MLVRNMNVFIRHKNRKSWKKYIYIYITILQKQQNICIR